MSNHSDLTRRVLLARGPAPQAEPSPLWCQWRTGSGQSNTQPWDVRPEGRSTRHPEPDVRQKGAQL